jgi:hypothetical protein
LPTSHGAGRGKLLVKFAKNAASLIKADVNGKKRAPGDTSIAWLKAEEASHAVREYLEVLVAA